MPACPAEDARHSSEPHRDGRGRLALMIFTSVAVMLLLTWIPGHTWDLWIFTKWAKGLLANGLGDPGVDFAMPYPPVFTLWLWVVGRFYALFGLDWYCDQLLKLLVLVPVFLSQGLLLSMLWQAGRRQEPAAPVETVLIVSAFNPLILFIGPIWGQTDFCALTLAIAAVQLLVSGGAGAIWGPAVFVLAVMSKQYALMLAPVVVALCLRHVRTADRRDLAWMGVCAAAVAAVLWAPYLWSGHAWATFARCFFHLDASAYGVAVYNAYNVWCLLSGEIRDDVVLFSADAHPAGGGFETLLTPKVLGTTALGLAMVFAFVQTLRAKDDRTVWSLVVFSTLAFFVLPAGVHERYLAPAVVASAAWAAADPRRLPWYLLLSFLGFANSVLEFPFIDYHLRHALAVLVVLVFLLMFISLLGDVPRRVWQDSGRRLGRAPWVVAVPLLLLWGGLVGARVQSQWQGQAAERLRHGDAPRTYLSELTPLACEPHCDPERFDKTVELQELSLRGVRYPRGISTRAPSEIVYPIPAGAREFAADVGLDDAALGERQLPWRVTSVPQEPRRVVFHVFVDGALAWSSSAVSPASPVEHCRVNIQEGKTLRLVVQPLDGDSAMCDWAGAVLL